MIVKYMNNDASNNNLGLPIDNIKFNLWIETLENNFYGTPLPLLRTFNTNYIKIDEDPNNYEDFFNSVKQQVNNGYFTEKEKEKEKVVQKICSVAWHYGVQNKYNNNRYVLLNCFNLLNMLD